MKLSSRTITLIISLLILASLVYFFTDIVAYVCVAWVLSMIGQPMMKFFQSKLKIWKFRAGSNFSAVLTLLVFFLVIFLIVRLFVPPIVEQINHLSGVDYVQIAAALEEPLSRLQVTLAKYGLVQADVPLEQQLQENFARNLEPAFIGKYFGGLLSTASNILVGVVSVLFITFFFLKDQGLFVNFLAAIMPPQYDSQVHPCHFRYCHYAVPLF